MKHKDTFNIHGMIALILMVAGLFQACETEIPDVDTEPPTFSFRISGDGFDQTFDQDTNFGSFQLNLREDARYDITFSGADSGGVKHIQWQYAADYVELDESIPSPWTTSSSGLITSVNWHGNRSNPLTGMLLTTAIRPTGENISHAFNIMVRDFGGASARENTVVASLNIYSGNHTTEIIRF